MAKPFPPSVITANALIEGDVIYLGPHDWTRNLAEAEVFTDEAIAQDCLIEASSQTDRIVGIYLSEVDPDGPAPVHFREDFRATGPSNYAHGKQADVART